MRSRAQGRDAVNRFDYCLKFVTQPQIEGGYSDHKADRGGATNHGVTQKTYDTFRRNAGLSLRSVRQITDDEVAAIYRTMYWNVAKCGLLPEPLDLYVFDAAVNHGPGRAAKLLQQALGVAVDGAIGPVTIDALQEELAAGQLQELCHNFLAIRLEFYDQIVDNDPSQKVFLAGWENRIEHLRLA